MTGIYLFAAAAGVPLVAWFLLSGSDDGGDGGAQDGIGGLMLRLLPLSTIAMAAAAFGVAGLLLEAVGTRSGTALAGACAVAAVAAALNSAAFAYLRRTDAAASVGETQLTGALGRVVVPVGPGHRGRIAVTVDGQERYLSAVALPDAPTGLEVGAPVLVVEVSGGIATVTRLDPELT